MEEEGGGVFQKDAAFSADMKASNGERGKNCCFRSLTCQKNTSIASNLQEERAIVSQENILNT